MRRPGPALVCTLVLIGLLTVTPALAQRRGGVLRVGTIGEPPALDAHWTTATITDVLTNHLYEKVPSIRHGDLHGLRTARKTVKGFNDRTDRPRFHGVWLER